MERITRFRAQILILLLVLVLGFYAFRLLDVQIIQTGGKPTDNTTTFTTYTIVKAARGEILDRNGNVMVGNRACYDLVINHFVLLSSDDPNKHLLQMVELCNELNIPYNDAFPMTKEKPFTYTLEQYPSHWQNYFQQYITSIGLDSDVTAPLLLNRLREHYDIPKEWNETQARQVIGLRFEMGLRGVIQQLATYVFLNDASSEAQSAILELNVPGLKVESSIAREYHTTYAAHVIGHTGKMNAEQWEYYSQKEGYISMDADVGQSGFELAFEEYLHGQDGERVDVTTADGTLVKSYYITEPKAGNNVELTLDLQLQIIAEDALAERLDWLRNGQVAGADGSDAEGGALVMMDVRTGEILACASYPTYDLAHLSEKFDEILATPFNAMYNRAFFAAYPPGSTYKMVVSIAALDAGYLSPTEKIQDLGVFTKYEGFAPQCIVWQYGQTHGSIDVRQALTESCNYFFFEVGDRLPLSVLDKTAKGLGLGEPTGIELDEEIGYRANQETKRLLHGEGEAGEFFDGDKIQAAIGQSDNQFTPLQLCVYASTLANQGRRWKATFLSRVVSADYRHLQLESKPTLMSSMEISQTAIDAYMDGMYGVTTEPGGTAYSIFNGYPVPVCAKTGTAETGLGIGSDNAAFVCFAPKDEPEIAIAIYGEKAGHGSSMAVIAKTIMDSYFTSHGAIGDAVTYENAPS